MCAVGESERGMVEGLSRRGGRTGLQIRVGSGRNRCAAGSRAITPIDALSQQMSACCHYERELTEASIVRRKRGFPIASDGLPHAFGCEDSEGSGVRHGG